MFELTEEQRQLLEKHIKDHWGRGLRTTLSERWLHSEITNKEIYAVLLLILDRLTHETETESE